MSLRFFACTVLSTVAGLAADRLEVALCDETETPLPVVTKAKAVIDLALNHDGVWVAWNSCAPATAPAAPRVTIRIRFSPNNRDRTSPTYVSGRAFRVMGRQDYAQVFLDAINAY